jgi:hypothetical protein
MAQTIHQGHEGPRQGVRRGSKIQRLPHTLCSQVGVGRHQEVQDQQGLGQERGHACLPE